MVQKNHQTGMLPNPSNAALFEILWVRGVFIKIGVWQRAGYAAVNVIRWPL